MIIVKLRARLRRVRSVDDEHMKSLTPLPSVRYASDRSTGGTKKFQFTLLVCINSDFTTLKKQGI